LQQLQELAGRS